MNDNEEYMLLECFGVFWNMLEVETMNWRISSFDIDSPTMNWNELKWNETKWNDNRDSKQVLYYVNIYI